MASLKTRIRAGERTIGSWMCLGNDAVTEIMAGAGFDWLVIDLEHSTTTLREAERMIRIADLKGVPPLVRLSGHDWAEAKRALDAGARGIIVPMIASAEEARAAARALQYPPRGSRGFGLGRAHCYGDSFAEYVRDIEPETILIAQVEHADSIAALDSILDVDGFDATMIGPYDLSGSIGKPGQFDDPDVQALCTRYVEVCARRGRAAGCHIVQPDHALAAERVRAGYSFIALGVDFLFLSDGCRRAMNLLRSAL